jgi:hypothetical protein
LQSRNEWASPRKGDLYRRSQLLLGGSAPASLRGSRSQAALDKLAPPRVQVAEAPAQQDPTRQRLLARCGGLVRRGFAAAERATGFSRSHLSLGIQMAVAFAAVMFLVVVPAVDDALVSGS